MGMTTISKRGPALSEAEVASIATFEAGLDAKLPSEYVAFLEEYNGGVPSPDGFMTDGGNNSDLVAILYGLRRDDEQTISIAIRRHDTLPLGLLPIGHTQVGNTMYLSLKPNQYGHVLLQDHETDDLEFVACSFREFLSILQALDDVLPPHRVEKVVIRNPEFLRKYRKQKE